MVSNPLNQVASSSKKPTARRRRRAEATATPFNFLPKPIEKELWPSHVEHALLEGLERIPPDFWPMRMQGGYPYSRTALLSEYILVKTAVFRTARQVNRHLKRLRQAWKGSELYLLVASVTELSRTPIGEHLLREAAKGRVNRARWCKPCPPPALWLEGLHYVVSSLEGHEIVSPLPRRAIRDLYPLRRPGDVVPYNDTSYSLLRQCIVLDMPVRLEPRHNFPFPPIPLIVVAPQSPITNVQSMSIDNIDPTGCLFGHLQDQDWLNAQLLHVSVSLPTDAYSSRELYAVQGLVSIDIVDLGHRPEGGIAAYVWTTAYLDGDLIFSNETSAVDTSAPPPTGVYRHHLTLPPQLWTTVLTNCGGVTIVQKVIAVNGPLYRGSDADVALVIAYQFPSSPISVFAETPDITVTQMTTTPFLDSEFESPPGSCSGTTCCDSDIQCVVYDKLPSDTVLPSDIYETSANQSHRSDTPYVYPPSLAPPIGSPIILAEYELSPKVSLAGCETPVTPG